MIKFVLAALEEMGFSKEQVYTTLKKLSDGAPLYTTAANYDAAVLSSVVVNAPGSSSGYDLFDQDVPFYQMVLSGERQLVSVPLNVTAGDVDAAFAQCVRFGMVPHFELIDSEEQMLGAYGLESFYAANYAVWGSRIVGYYAEYSTVYEAIKGRTLEDYRILSPGVYQLTYSGEVQLTVNETGDVARFTVQS